MYEMSDRVLALKSDLEDVMATHIYPSEAEFSRQSETLGPWAVFPIIEELKLVARRQGLWNLWHGVGDTGVPLGDLEYEPLVDVMGRSLMAPVVMIGSASGGDSQCPYVLTSVAAVV